MILQKKNEHLLSANKTPQKKGVTHKKLQKKALVPYFFVSMVSVCVKRQAAVDIWLKGFSLGSL